MRKRASDLKKSRGAPTKSRRSYRLLELAWLAFKRNNPSLTHEQAARKFLRVRGQWISETLGLRVGGYTRLRNASADGQQIRSERMQWWHIRKTSITGSKLFTDLSAGEAILQEAQGRYLLAGIGSDLSLANPGG
jgi:hypothetical protein